MKNKNRKNMATMTFDEIENVKYTENGDKSFKSTTDNLLDILFMSEYYAKHIDEVKIGNSEKDKLFSMFIRDPRKGLGKRDLGRELMFQSGVYVDYAPLAGRFDDVFYKWNELDEEQFCVVADYMYDEVLANNELAKKWMPRYSSKNKALAVKLANYYCMTKKEYGKFIKVDTTESRLSRKDVDSVKFEHVPSLALLKYYKRFKEGEDTSSRFAEYLESVSKGEKKINVSTTNVYDIYRNRNSIDADIFFDKVEKISISCLPIVDTSGSMIDSNDSFGKALAVGHYLSKCSTYHSGKVMSFSSEPVILTLGEPNKYVDDDYYMQQFVENRSQYVKEILSMYTGDCSNTDFGRVCDLLKVLDKNDSPEWLVVLSDQEFDYGSNTKKDEMMAMFKENGLNTKIVWWNFNSRNKTAPETDKYGNIFMSGYNPYLLTYLKVGFDSEKFLNELLINYAEYIAVESEKRL